MVVLIKNRKNIFPRPIVLNNHKSFVGPYLDYGDNFYDKHHSVLPFKTKLVIPFPNNVFDCHNPKGVKLMARLQFGLSQFPECSYKHSFHNSFSLFCSSGSGVIEFIFYKITITHRENITDSNYTIMH